MTDSTDMLNMEMKNCFVRMNTTFEAIFNIIYFICLKKPKFVSIQTDVIYCCWNISLGYRNICSKIIFDAGYFGSIITDIMPQTYKMVPVVELVVKKCRKETLPGRCLSSAVNLDSCVSPHMAMCLMHISVITQAFLSEAE